MKLSNEKLDSEVLKMVTRMLEDMANDEQIGEFGRENANSTLNMIGKTYILLAQNNEDE
jgi:hypothetical protein